MKSFNRLGCYLAVSLALFGVFFLARSPRHSVVGSVPGLVSEAVIPGRPAFETRRPESEMFAPPPTSAIETSALPASAFTLIGSTWASETTPEFTAFRGWAERYLTAASGEQAGLEAEGRALAVARRETLASLIVIDPKAALGAAVPQTVRERLPLSVGALLEERISGRGGLSLVSVLLPEKTNAADARPYHHEASVSGRTYLAYAYGRRLRQSMVADAHMLGIAIGDRLALDESPLRLLERGENAGARPVEAVCEVSGQATSGTADLPLNTVEETAVEYDGKIQVLCSPAHVPVLAQRLVDGEAPAPGWLAAGEVGGTSIANTPPPSWTHGAKRILVLPIDFTDYPAPYPLINGSPESGMVSRESLLAQFGPIGDFYVQNSYGKASLDVDVLEIIRMDNPSGGYGNYLNVREEAYAKAVLAGKRLEDYESIGIVAPRISRFGAGLGWALLSDYTGRLLGQFYINGVANFGIMTHEIGHTFGLNHSGLLNGVDVVGEYGDNYDLMGSGHQPVHHFSHWNKTVLNWIPEEAIVRPSAAGVYRIYRFDHRDADLTLPRVLWLPRDPVRSYWIGYRRATSDATMDNGAYVVLGYPYNARGDLVPFTIGTMRYNALPIGQSYMDYEAGVSISPVAQGGTGAEEWLDVQVTHITRFEWAQASYAVAEGASVSLTVRRQGSHGPASVNYTTMPGSAASPDDFTAAGGTLIWADGDAAPKTITLNAKVDYRREATEQFSVQLSGATIGGSASVTVNVTNVFPALQPPVFDGVVRRVVPMNDPDSGRVLVLGDFSTVMDAAGVLQPRPGIARLNGDGSLDPSFSAGSGPKYGRIYDAAVQADGKIVIGGSFQMIGDAYRFFVARLNADGSLDHTFNPLPAPGPNAAVYSVLIQDLFFDEPYQKILIGGAFTAYNGVAREYLTRLNLDGSLDTSFVGPNFAGTGGGRINSLLIEPYEENILLGGRFSLGTGAAKKSGICRLWSNGALDPWFSAVTAGVETDRPAEDGSVETIALQGDGTILIGGRFSKYNGETRRNVARLRYDGVCDPGFHPSLNGTCSAIAVLPDGDIVLAGAFNTIDGHPAHHIARLKPNGLPNPAFSAAGGHGGTVYDISFRSDGLVLMGGVPARFRNSSQSRPVWGWAP